MSNTLDPRLKLLRHENRQTLGEIDPSPRLGLASEPAAPPRARVLLRFDGDLAAIERRGFETATVAGDVATGSVSLDRLEDIAELPNVVRLEGSRPMTPELDSSVPEIGADRLHGGPPALTGQGVIIGVIDSGIDYLHENFRHPDGTSRILSIWDQALSPTDLERSPGAYGYGVEYRKVDIDRALDAPDPSELVRHGHDPRFPAVVNRARLQHGTHVAGVAAGNGAMAGGTSRSSREPAFTYTGVAPEADLVFVANSAGTEALGDSANTLDAIAYVFELATSLGKPAVVNLSQGDHLGPHDGTSLLERGLDHLLGEPGRAVVKSAGNAAGLGVHASGRVFEGQREDVRLRMPTRNASPDTLDIWYPGSDRFSFRLTTPGGRSSELVRPGETTTLSLRGGNEVFVDSVLADPDNGDNRIYLQISRGSADSLEEGAWTLHLVGDSVLDGRFDAWIERGGVTARFVGEHVDDRGTLTVPGTSFDVITVGSYVTKGDGLGDLSTFSSRGPTRDGRRKPEIIAPGERIVSVLPTGSRNAYSAGAGTSLAAPHVAGAVALLLQENPRLSQRDIRTALETSARRDGGSGEDWGAGKLDAQAAAEAAADLAVSASSEDPAPDSSLDLSTPNRHAKGPFGAPAAEILRCQR